MIYSLSKFFLHGLFKLYVPPRTLRPYQTFELEHHRTLCGQNSLINRIMRNGNEFQQAFFNITINAKKLTEILTSIS